MWKSAGPDVILKTEATAFHICGLLKAASSGAKSEKFKVFSVIFHPSELMKTVLFLQHRVTNLFLRPLWHFPQLKTKVENSHKPPVSYANIKFGIFSVDPGAGQQQKGGDEDSAAAFAAADLTPQQFHSINSSFHLGLDRKA